MIENYFIELKKKRKSYALLIQDNMITQYDGDNVEHIVDMDNMKRDMYWVLCLNLMRKGWHITKANNIPDFDISFMPRINISNIDHIVHSTRCMLIPNSTTYFFDEPSLTTWETTTVQVYSPKCVIEKLSALPFSLQFCAHNYNNTMYIPLCDDHSAFLLSDGYNIPPCYNNWNQARIAIHMNTELWKAIRFFGHGDLDINSFLRIMNSSS